MIRTLLAIMMLSSLAFGQGACKTDVAYSTTTTGGKTVVIPAALTTIRVCSPGATGTPCSPLSLIYTDETLNTITANPFTADAYGNFTVCTLPGKYDLQETYAGSTLDSPLYSVPLQSLDASSFPSPAYKYQPQPWPTLMGVLNGTYQPAPATFSGYTASTPNSTPTPLVACGMYADLSGPFGDEANTAACIKAFVVGESVLDTGAQNVAAIMGVAQTNGVGTLPSGATAVEGFANLNTADPNAVAFGAWFMASDNNNPGNINGIEVNTSKQNGAHAAGSVIGGSFVNYGANGGGIPTGNADGDIGVRIFGYGVGVELEMFQSTCGIVCYGFYLAPSTAANNAKTTWMTFAPTANPYSTGLDFSNAVFTQGALKNPSIGGGIKTSGTGLKHFSICASSCDVTATICTTSGVLGNVCTTAITMPGTAFANAAYSVTCSGVGAPGGIPVLSVVTKAASTLTIQIQTAIASPSTFPEVDCTAIHN